MICLFIEIFKAKSRTIDDAWLVALFLEENRMQPTALSNAEVSKALTIKNYIKILEPAMAQFFELLKTLGEQNACRELYMLI